MQKTTSWIALVLHFYKDLDLKEHSYNGRKITESFGNVTVRGEKRWKEQGGSAMANSLSEHV
jgi:hypothetical protein